MALRMGETANFPGRFTAQSPKCTNSRTFHSRERPVSNSRTFPVFPVVWEPCDIQHRGHYGEHSCEVILLLDQWFEEDVL